MLQVDCEFPGGNIVVERIDGDEVWLRQDRRDTEGWWFYWLLRIRGAAGREVTFHFTDGNPFTHLGPSISEDFVHWSWPGAEVITEEDGSENVRVTCRFPAEPDVFYLTYSIPYLESHLAAFLAGHARHPHLRRSTLTTSEEGRPVEKLVLRNPQAKAPRKIMLSARRHACESVANYVIEGFIDFALDASERLLDAAEVLIVPFVDKDGVENGDQGKNRRPHDHNRDHTDAPIYAATRAIIHELDGWADGRFDVSLDVHCPWIRGGRNDSAFFCEPPEPYLPACRRFCEILADAHPGPLPFDPANNIGCGVDWNTGTEPTFNKWVRDHTAARIAMTLEFPYALAGGEAVTADGARAFGRSLGRATRQWMADSK